MNILVDRHQAGLYHALQLLFEDRLGHTLYTPIGQEWWTSGIWRFGEVFGDDRLAQQYLTTSGWVACAIDGFYHTKDSEFPDRAITGITLAEANLTEWLAVIATVQENQAGFARFAQEHGAKFVVQVGNTGQRIDWSLDPLVLNSSEMPMFGRGVRIGQEFDSDGLFGYSDPASCSRTSVASFVNCMTSIQCYPLMQTFMDALPEFSWRVHGIDGPDGNLKPITAIRDAMAAAGWGWHDKAHGDGFGHILHYWAALGRPIIGHGSHYRGKNGEVFWRDLETCIDLDKHSFEETVALIREITADPPRHEAMCRAIRAVFDATTDWEGDAEKVRVLLG